MSLHTKITKGQRWQRSGETRTLTITNANTRSIYFDTSDGGRGWSTTEYFRANFFRLRTPAKRRR